MVCCLIVAFFSWLRSNAAAGSVRESVTRSISRFKPLVVCFHSALLRRRAAGMIGKQVLEFRKEATPVDRLEAMSVIIAVTETGSISAASRRLKSPVATVSRKVAELETRLKAQLFQRTSRRMTLTDAGRSYIEACKRIIEQVDDAEREVSGEYRMPKGDLGVTSPWGLGHTHLLPLAVEFLKAYPDIGLRLMLTDRVVNTVEEGIDIAIRVGTLPD